MSHVDVIIPTFNRDFSVIEKAIKSVLKQSYADIGIILVDDNGEKHPEISEKISKKIIDYKMVKYIHLEENKGACHARNIGIMNSNATYIAFLDDDDTWEKNKIEEQIKLFNDENVGLVYCGLKNFFEKKNKIVYKKAKTKNNPVKSLLRNNYIGTTSCGIVKRDVAIKCGMFDEKLKSGQDLDFWIRIALISNIKNVDKCLVNYTFYSKNTITSNYKNRLFSNIYLRKKYDFIISKSLYLRFIFKLKIFKAYLKNKMYRKGINFLIFGIKYENE